MAFNHKSISWRGGDLYAGHPDHFESSYSNKFGYKQGNITNRNLVWKLHLFVNEKLSSITLASHSTKSEA